MQTPDAAPAHGSDRTCVKCGSTEIRVQWHEGSWSQNKRKTCSYDDARTGSGEHLHAYCQGCHFDWTEDTLDALTG